MSLKDDLMFCSSDITRALRASFLAPWATRASRESFWIFSPSWITPKWRRLTFLGATTFFATTLGAATTAAAAAGTASLATGSVCWAICLATVSAAATTPSFSLPSLFAFAVAKIAACADPSFLCIIFALASAFADSTSCLVEAGIFPECCSSAFLAASFFSSSLKWLTTPLTLPLPLKAPIIPAAALAPNASLTPEKKEASSFFRRAFSVTCIAWSWDTHEFVLDLAWWCPHESCPQCP
mmetsp:Transcript_53322/g.126882  ORF Transcript_53322/g.126882 Transcript_53322/m.126882 type:complete len:240 (-) Transcript_53322:303-1022(-)